jgi:hypothetical protein
MSSEDSAITEITKDALSKHTKNSIWFRVSGDFESITEVFCNSGEQAATGDHELGVSGNASHFETLDEAIGFAYHSFTAKSTRNFNHMHTQWSSIFGTVVRLYYAARGQGSVFVDVKTKMDTDQRNSLLTKEAFLCDVVSVSELPKTFIIEPLVDWSKVLYSLDVKIVDDALLFLVHELFIDDMVINVSSGEFASESQNTSATVTYFLTNGMYFGSGKGSEPIPFDEGLLGGVGQNLFNSIEQVIARVRLLKNNGCINVVGINGKILECKLGVLEVNTGKLEFNEKAPFDFLDGHLFVS